MHLFRIPRLVLLTGLLALFAFTGDIVTDAVADVRGHQCEQTSHNSKSGTCAVCDCIIHAGAIVTASFEPFPPINDTGIDHTFREDLQRLTKLAAAIDHPPQLS